MFTDRVMSGFSVATIGPSLGISNTNSNNQSGWTCSKKYDTCQELTCTSWRYANGWGGQWVCLRLPSFASLGLAAAFARDRARGIFDRQLRPKKAFDAIMDF